MVSFSCGILDPVMLANNCLYTSVSFLKRLHINSPPKELPEINNMGHRAQGMHYGAGRVPLLETEM